MDAIPVLLDRYASPEEVGDVRAVFERRGATAMVKPLCESLRRPARPILDRARPPRHLLQSLRGRILRKLGEDAADALREYAGELRRAREQSTLADDGWVEFDDPEDTKVMLAAGAPDEAYRALLELDWSEHRGGNAHVDDATREWYDPNRCYGGRMRTAAPGAPGEP
jgi:hypothetical protein